MSKNLDAIKYLNDTCINFLDRTKELYCTITFTRKRAEILRDNIAEVGKSLKRLEAIDNANPSEALECSLKLYKMVESAGNGNGFSLNKAWKYHNTIKQALLNAQEQENKKYLKWEDLEFKELEFKVEQKKDFKVKLNGTEYGLEICITFGIKEALIFDINANCLYAVFHERHKHFFNDLHLERVEE